jgi:ABC-type lipoprotein export system ATPase subunit
VYAEPNSGLQVLERMVFMITLKEFEVKNYRSCVDTKSKFISPLTALIGKNGAGKTNFLNAIRLLRDVGSLRQLRYLNESPDYELEDRSTITAKFEIGGQSVAVKSNLSIDSQAGIETVIYAETKIRNFDVKYSRWEDAYFPSRVSSAPPRSILARIEREKKLRSANTAAFNEPLARYFGDIQYYSATQFSDPSKCPLSLELDTNRPSGQSRRTSDHERLLYNIFAEWSTRSVEYDRFFSVVGPQGLRLVDDFRFLSYDVTSDTVRVRQGGKVSKSPRVREWIVPSVIVDGLQLSPSQLSEGTFKTIALVFYILAGEGNLLLLEEPEVCVHHGLLDSIIELLKIESKSKQIIVSTHSDYVLDMLEPSNVQIVNKTPDGTVITPISKSMETRDFKALKTYLRTTGTLGEYWKESGLSDF